MNIRVCKKTETGLYDTHAMLFFLNLDQISQTLYLHVGALIQT